jgi:hypothetical protein
MSANRLAYQTKYEGKRYNVIGRINTIEFADGEWGVVHVILEPWEEIGMNSRYEMPDVWLSGVPRDTQLAMRPGQDIDATCVLSGWMKFEGCELNKPIDLRVISPSQRWVCKRLRSLPECRGDK